MRLVGALLGQQRLWDGVRADFLGDPIYLQVVFDVGDRPLYLVVGSDGQTLHFRAPIMVAFPAAASHFVLTELAGGMVYSNFEVIKGAAKRQVKDASGRASKKAVDVLWGYGQMPFEGFVKSSYRLGMLSSGAQVAERRVQQFLEETPPIFKLVA
jgi:hypothetical protein